jgi:hypothetical protein
MHMALTMALTMKTVNKDFGFRKRPNIYIYIYARDGSLVGWLVGDQLLLRDFGPNRIIFMTM